MSFRTMRLCAGLTICEVAKSVGVASSTVSNWECGVYAPNPENMRRLAGLYHCTVADLLPPESPAGVGPDFGSRLKAARKRMGLSRLEFADLLGLASEPASRNVSVQTRNSCAYQAVYRWENGVSFPRGPMVKKIVEVTGLDVNYFFGAPTQTNLQPSPAAWYLQECSSAELLSELTRRLNGAEGEVTK